MKQHLIVGMLICFLCYFSGILTNAQAIDVNAVFQQLKGELLNKGLTASDINAAERPAKNMLSLGATQADVISVLVDFVAKGFKGNDLGSLVGMVSDLMKSGSSTKISVGTVSQAIQQASVLGLKGKDLLVKVQNIVNQKKAQLEQLKSGLGTQKSQITGEVDKAKKDLGSLLGK